MLSFAESLQDMTTLSPIRSRGTSITSFEAWVDRSPGSIAVSEGSTSLTYLQVEQRANQIAHGLRSAGVQKGDLVALFLERGTDLVCALLGILKAGAAFVALDPKMPKEALSLILSSVDCRFILSRVGLEQGLPETSAKRFFLDDQDWLAFQPVSRIPSLADPADPACVLFTSGSAGRSKAVLYLHQNLAARFSNTYQVSRFNPMGVFAQTSPVTSIDAIDEILLPLVSGGRTVILPYDTVTNPHRLINSLSAHKVTHILLVPSLLRVILAVEEDLETKLASLEICMIGGESLTGELTHQFYAQLPRAVLINFYGLTEGDATSYVTSSLSQYDSGVPIGGPIQDTKIYLLDEQLNIVSEGTPGEICLAGPGLFHEYLGCPELNTERWVLNPFESDGSYARLFRTGDMGRLRPDGQIEYLGRRDRMVKVRGFRVELGAVETALSRHPVVDHCVAIAKRPAGKSDSSADHQTFILVYAVLKNGKKATPQELRDFLKDYLPAHALPARIFLLDSLPLSPNGKVDVQALLKFDSMKRELYENHMPPRDSVELRLAQIWEKLLNVHPIGVTDSFFDVGGDSLAAIDLMLIIEKEFQIRLPITVLIQSPTIAGLAEVLRADVKAGTLDSLVPIRVQGSRPPLFCIHADGSVFIYRQFAEYLDPRIPIYGLQAHGLANPNDQPFRHVDEMAAHYIRQIRTVQPRGPYHLCAFSAGGLITFEMARQLQALGEQVAFVGLLDAYGPDYPEYLPAKRANYKISVHWNTLRLHGISGQSRYIWGRVQHGVFSLLSGLSADFLLKLRLPMPRRIRYEYIADLIERAAQLYPRGRTFAGEITLFRALSQPKGIKPERSLGWASLTTGDLKIVDVVGTHNSIMRHEPHMAELVQKINRHLSQLHSRFPSQGEDPGSPIRLS